MPADLSVMLVTLASSSQVLEGYATLEELILKLRGSFCPQVEGAVDHCAGRSGQTIAAVLLNI